MATRNTSNANTRSPRSPERGHSSNSRSRSTSTSSRSSRSRSSSVARAFLTEEQEDFRDLIPTSRYQEIVRSAGVLHPDEEEESEEEEEESSDEVSYCSSSARNSSRWERENDLNRVVDQSINLMDVEANSYSADPGQDHGKTGFLQQNYTGKKTNKASYSAKEKSQKYNRTLLGALLVVLMVTFIFSLTYVQTSATSGPLLSTNNNNATATSVPTHAQDNHFFENKEQVTNKSPKEVAPITDAPTAKPTNTPTQPPPPLSPQAQREQTLTSILAKHYRNNDIQNPNAQKAIQWMTQYSEHTTSLWNTPQDHAGNIHYTRNEAEEESILQRYALAAFFFATHPAVEPEQTPAAADEDSSSMDPEETHDSDEDNQRYLRQLWFTAPPTSKSEWMSTAHICSWRGIECDDTTEEDQLLLDDNATTSSPPLAPKRIVLLDLSRSQLKGQLPIEFAFLLKRETALIQLDLSNNELEGPLPSLATRTPPTSRPSDEMEDSQLEFLFLQNNQLTGSVPPFYLASENLYHVDLSQNQFTGALPLTAKLSHLRKLYVNDNRFSSTLPGELFHLYNLFDLRLHNNKLQGSLKNDLAKLTQLTTITLGSNRLTGSLPNAAWEGLVKLAKLDLHKNQFTGSVPESIPKLPLLEDILLGENQLKGKLPDQWVATSKLQSLVLHKNQLTGTISSKLGGLSYLKDLWLNENKLVGSIPPQMAQLVRLEKLFLNDNALEGSLPPITNLHHLESLEIQNNQLSFSLAPEVCQMKKMYSLRFICADCFSGKVKCSCCEKC